VVILGGGSWNVSSYQKSTQAKIDNNQTFGYSSATRHAPTSSWAAHEDLDPTKVAGPASPLAGQIVRESRDNADHPNSVPIAVLFDVTGSNVADAARVQAKLANLFGLLLRKGYVEDPQILIGAYGDAQCDRVPLQVSQFESDNRVDDALDKLFLEGNGGGNGGESLALAAYYLTHHTATDALEKRNKKGYAFFIADEITHEITAAQITRFIGDGEPLGPIDNKSLVKDFQEKWEVFILVIDNYSAKAQGSVGFYKKLFGEDHVLVLETPESVTETIGIVIGVQEGTVDLQEATDDLIEAGTSDVAIRGAVQATQGLAKLARPTAAGTVAVANGKGAARL
jgi:hypothetical protein